MEGEEKVNEHAVDRYKNILPSRFGDNHFCSKFVEFIPKFFLIQGNFGIVLDRVILGKGNSWRNSSEGESR